jgi:hypothetical protein
MNLTLLAALALLAAWGVLVFGTHLGAGWVHLLYALGVILLARRIVTGAPRFRS